MNTILIVALVIAVILIGLIVYNHYRSKNKPEIKKSDKILVLNKKNFLSGTKSGLVLVDFWAGWCQPCKLMIPVLNDLAETQGENITVAKVNVEREQFLASKYKVKNIPTMILFKDGVEYKRFVGVKTKRVLLKEINS